MKEEIYLTENQLADRLNVSPRTLQVQRQRSGPNTIPFQKLGKSVRYFWPEVDAFLKRHRKRACDLSTARCDD